VGKAIAETFGRIDCDMLMHLVGIPNRKPSASGSELASMKGMLSSCNKFELVQRHIPGFRSAVLAAAAWHSPA
jgi:hypothetical protein